MKFIRRTFPIKQCKYNLEKPFRPCIQYQIGRCLAPCAENLREPEHKQRYAEIVKEIRLFLQGENKELLTSLQERMQKHSDELRYEEAGELRDRIKLLERAWETQRVISPELGDMDVIGIYREHEQASIFMLFVRNGMVIGQKNFFLKNLKGVNDKELTAGFIEQFYSKEMLIPPKIILPVRGSFETQGFWLSKKRDGRVKLTPARSKEEKEIFKMASDNALHSFTGHKETKTSEILIALKNLLNLKTLPKRIAAVDVSNISGSEAVGAVVVWEDGGFVKDDYRLFKIKTVAGIDDFAMIGEVVGRHFHSLYEKGGELPQLFLIDGGRGQLESALNAIKPFALPVEIAAIAKAKEEKADRIFLPGRSTAISLEPASASTHLLQRIRDEVHRFAISYHKKLRAKRTLESPLEKIKGIGKKRRLALLKHFGSIDNIRKASHDDIAGIKGFNKKIAEKVLEGVK
ncbi:MAG: excinuclease ABC subunit UvrC [Nitrospirae bacterium]|nr:excinuclease ABC subunit UvrC [Nitrospirota bacterium]